VICPTSDIVVVDDATVEEEEVVDVTSFITFASLILGSIAGILGVSVVDCVSEVVVDADTTSLVSDGTTTSLVDSGAIVPSGTSEVMGEPVISIVSTSSMASRVLNVSGTVGGAVGVVSSVVPAALSDVLVAAVDNSDVLVDSTGSVTLGTLDGLTDVVVVISVEGVS